MGIWDRIKGLIKSPSVDYTSGAGLVWQNPPEGNMESYIQAYKNVGTLHAVISRIANAVGETKWRLFKIQKNGKRKELTDHPLLNLLHYMNEFQTGNEVFELTQMHMDLTGRAFWVLNYNRNKQPAEIWLAEPQKMTIQTDSKKFISHYTYRNGSNEQKLKVDDVIYFPLPDPGNIYGGASPTQAAGADIDIERFTRRWQKRFFYNNATPQGILNIPGVEEEDLERFKSAWKQSYGGYTNAHKMAFLNAEDIKYEKMAFSQREMDFWRSDKANRDRLLLSMGMPLSVMGISENVNRANAEAGEYLFVRWVVHPRLVRIREKLNEQLCPKFAGKNEVLELDFDEPVPESKEQLLKQATEGVKAGYMTVNEARKAQGLDELPEGNVLLVPMQVEPMQADKKLQKSKPKPAPAPPAPNPEANPEGNPEVTLPEPPDKKSYKTEEEKDDFWKAYAGKTEDQEKPVVVALQSMFDVQRKDALNRLNEGNKDNLLDKRKSKKQYKDAVKSPLLNVIIESVDDGLDLAKPVNPHKYVHLVYDGANWKQEPNEAALEWLDTRIGWAAEEVGEETARLLAKTLKDGVAAGEDIRQLRNRVTEVFDFCDRTRATRIARTEVIMASNEGRLHGYKDAGLEKVEFFAAQDERICPECDDLHGMVREVSESHGLIPVHPDCRCVWIPVLE